MGYSSDGAHSGIGAERALKTILGGEPAPAEDEMESREQVRKRIMAAPGPGGEWRVETYGQAADAIAKALVFLIEEDPSLLGVSARRTCFAAAVEEYPSGLGAVAPYADYLSIGQYDKADGLYDLIEKRWPGFDDRIGGASGFQVGWATNCARWLYEQRPVPNPALLTIG